MKRADDRRQLQLKLDGIDEQRYGELRHAEDVNRQLADRLATAEQRLLVRVTSSSCPTGSLRSATTGAGMDDGAHYVELHPATAADLAELAGDADACAIKLTALQDRERARLSK
ncbi:Bacteriophage lysis protein [compost metagenome]